MTNSEIFNSTILAHLFSTKLDKILLTEIKNENIFLSKNNIFIQKKDMFSNFEDAKIILRIKNYIESGIIFCKEQDIHKISFKINFSSLNKEISCLKLTNIGENIIKKIGI